MRQRFGLTGNPLNVGPAVQFQAAALALSRVPCGLSAGLFALWYSGGNCQLGDQSTASEKYWTGAREGARCRLGERWESQRERFEQWQPKLKWVDMLRAVDVGMWPASTAAQAGHNNPRQWGFIAGLRVSVLIQDYKACKR
jgi:hypothetical protein